MSVAKLWYKRRRINTNYVTVGVRKEKHIAALMSNVVPVVLLVPLVITFMYTVKSPNYTFFGIII